MELLKSYFKLNDIKFTFEDETEVTYAKIKLLGKGYSIVFDSDDNCYRIVNDAFRRAIVKKTDLDVIEYFDNVLEVL